MAKNTIKTYDFNQPQSLINIADTLKRHIIKENLYVSVKGKNYVLVEGWQFAGGLLGVYPVVTELKNISTEKEIKYSSVVKLTHKGEIVGAGGAICSNKERGKTAFEEYAVASMAQTRATGKAYRLLIGWVMKSAGYEATPAEEMTHSSESSDKKKDNVFTIAKEMKNSTKEEKETFLEIYKSELSESEFEELKSEIDYV